LESMKNDLVDKEIEREPECLTNSLEHLGNELVDESLTVAAVATLDEVVDLGVHAALGGGELEGPEEAVDLTEVGTAGVDLVNEVLHADDAKLAKLALNDRVVNEGDALAVDLTVTALVDELADGLEGGVTPGDVGGHETEHLDGGLVEADENTVVDLAEAEELEDLLGLRGDTVDTADTDDEGDLSLGGDVEVTGSLGLAAEGDLHALLAAVLSDVSLGAAESNLAGSLVSGLGLESADGTLSAKALSGTALLENDLGDCARKSEIGKGIAHTKA
jgi:hypothetical protein